MGQNTIVIVGTVIGAVILLLIRELCWFWKVNQIRDLLKDICDRLPQKIKAEISEKQAKERNNVRLRQTKGSGET